MSTREPINSKISFYLVITQTLLNLNSHYLIRIFYLISNLMSLFLRWRKKLNKPATSSTKTSYGYI